MLTRRIRAALMTSVLTLGVALSGEAIADITAKEATELNTQAKATLTKFKADTKGSDAVLASAKGILVCPKITKGGLIVGVEGGNCVLTSGAPKPFYYSTAAVKGGLLAGVQSYSMILVFNSAEALNKLRGLALQEAGGQGLRLPARSGRSGGGPARLAVTACLVPNHRPAGPSVTAS